MTKHDTQSTAAALLDEAMQKARLGQSEAACALAQSVLNILPTQDSAAALIQLLSGAGLPETPHEREVFGRVALMIGKLDAAEIAFATLCAKDTASAEQFALWGSVAQGRNDIDTAWNRFSRALTLDPNNNTARTGRAVVHWMRGNLSAARSGLEKIVSDAPELLNPQYVLAEVMFAQGAYADAVRLLDQILRQNPGFLPARQVFLRGLAKLPQGARLLPDASVIEDSYDIADLEIESLAQASLATLLDATGMDAFWQGDWSDPDAAHRLAATAPPLLGKVLRRQIISDFQFETSVQNLRRALLLVLIGNERIPQATLWLAEATAQQSWLNEYLLPAHPQEVKLLRDLAAGPQAATVNGLLAQALFAPLTDLPAARQWLDQGQTSVLDDLIQHQIHDLDQEREIARDLPAMATLENDVSRAVNAQYEQNPYPRWRTLSRTSRTAIDVFLRRQFAHWKPQRDFAQPQILVAGCGTGRDLTGVSSQFDAAHVTGIDLSRASLAYGTRMTRKLGVTGVSLLHGDILGLTDWGRKFDVIVSSGVLHHMQDPVAGWAQLVNCLNAGGVMKIALYSEVARQGIVAGQQIVADHTLPATPQGIAQARRVIADLPPDHPAQLCPTTRDFYYQSGVRDLIFHVQEHRFTLPKLAETLDQLGLRLIGFELPGEVLASYRALFPDDPKATNLVYWAAFERLYPLTFLQMYQFWCERRPQ